MCRVPRTVIGQRNTTKNRRRNEMKAGRPLLPRDPPYKINNRIWHWNYLLDAACDWSRAVFYRDKCLRGRWYRTQFAAALIKNDFLPPATHFSQVIRVNNREKRSPWSQKPALTYHAICMAHGRANLQTSSLCFILIGTYKNLLAPRLWPLANFLL